MRIKNKDGFTLIEIMVVVVILGLLMAVAVPKFSSNKRYELENTVRNLVRDIRYAQQEAMNLEWQHNQSGKFGVKIKFNPKTETSQASYRLFYVDYNGADSPLGYVNGIGEKYTEEIKLPPGVDFVEKIPETLNLASSDETVYIIFNRDGEIDDWNKNNNSWDNTVSGFVYLQDIESGSQVSIEITKPWGKITVRDYPK